MTSDINVTVGGLPSIGTVETLVPSPVEVVMVVQQGPRGPLPLVKTINGVIFAGVGNIDLFHAHEQVAPSDTWTVVHGLGKNPAVSVVDSANSLVVGEVTYLDLNTVVLSFNSHFAGRAFFN